MHGFCLYAYCVMDNHVHLVIKEQKDSISRIMKRIETSYVNYFNKKYKRVGHALKRYVRRSDKDLNRLMKYAVILRIEKVLRNYLEVLREER